MLNKAVKAGVRSEMTEMSGRASARASGRALISATMSDIEVEATVKPALSEESLGREASYREIGQLSLEILDLRKLDPDINGDGKISSEEKTIYKMLMVTCELCLEGTDRFLARRGERGRVLGKCTL